MLKTMFRKFWANIIFFWVILIVVRKTRWHFFFGVQLFAQYNRRAFLWHQVKHSRVAGSFRVIYFVALKFRFLFSPFRTKILAAFFSFSAPDHEAYLRCERVRTPAAVACAIWAWILLRNLSWFIICSDRFCSPARLLASPVDRPSSKSAWPAILASKNRNEAGMLE